MFIKQVGELVVKKNSFLFFSDESSELISFSLDNLKLIWLKQRSWIKTSELLKVVFKIIIRMKSSMRHIASLLSDWLSQFKSLRNDVFYHSGLCFIKNETLIHTTLKFCSFASVQFYAHEIHQTRFSIPAFRIDNF